MKKCRIDGQDCNFEIKYKRVFAQKFMVRVSECRLSSSNGYYPTHVDHCKETEETENNGHR